MFWKINDGGHEMEGPYEIRQALLETVGEQGCGGATCDDADVFYDEEGWKLMMCGFLEPWKLGKTVEEARQSLKEYGSMGFGLA
jgi:hypothetical protein